MTVRTRQTRHDWWPVQRIEGLKRYAFIGDSTMFGAGVPPDENLPFYAERQLNEALPDWPVEAVNYGVSGYNIWNSWIAIKPLLPLFDGLVLALCNNDAEMFGRTYGVSLPDIRFALWESDDPFGAAVAACFADIARCAKALNLPVMVVYSNVFGTPRQTRLHEIIAGHCAANGLDYIHTYPLYAARHLPTAQLVVSRADGHPSGLAHELAARHVVAEMVRLGWFRDDVPPVAAMPQQLQHAATAMMRLEDYPPDAALGWALRALEAKTRVAKRRAALEGVDHFEPAAAPVRAALQAQASAWHVALRGETCALELAHESQGLSASLLILQGVRLRLEELGFALAEQDALPALARLPAATTPPAPLAEEPPAFFAQCHARLAAEAAALVRLAALSEAAARAVTPLRRFITLLAAEAAALESAVAATSDLLRARYPALPPAQQDSLLRLLQEDIAVISRRLTVAAKQSGWTARLERAQIASYTMVEAVLRTSITEGVILLSLRAEYAVPHRLAFMRNAMLSAASQPVTARFYVPLLYAGRVTFCAFAGPGGKYTGVTEILECRVSNDAGVSRNVPPGAFYRDEQGDWVSPPLFLV